MATHDIGTDRPVSPLDREEIARIEVGHTNVSRRVAKAMVATFLLMLAVLPLVEFRGALGALGAAGAAGAPRAPSASAAAWDRLVAANRVVLAKINAFEAALEDRSAMGRLLRPPAQRGLSGWFGAGNERVYIGRDGWLFYRPDVEYVTGRGFLDPRELERRVAAASEYETPPQPDPRPAIRQFARDLAARGITLVLVPTPVKPSIHPDRLSRRAGARDAGALHNLSYDALLDELRRDGVLVFDPSSDLARARAAGDAQYLATDTHWRPETVQRVAAALAAFVREHAGLPARESPGYDAERREARQTGDITAMLDLPTGQTLYPPERVALRYVVDEAGNPWRSSQDADVLLLGDSFTNIYSLATMGWGEGAGLAEQLSYVLQRPVDRIVQNDQGAHATRGLLHRELAAGTDRLAGKRVVIWQFAAREFAAGDWKVIGTP